MLLTTFNILFEHVTLGRIMLSVQRHSLAKQPRSRLLNSNKYFFFLDIYNIFYIIKLYNFSVDRQTVNCNFRIFKILIGFVGVHYSLLFLKLFDYRNQPTGLQISVSTY